MTDRKKKFKLENLKEEKIILKKMDHKRKISKRDNLDNQRKQLIIYEKM